MERVEDKGTPVYRVDTPIVPGLGILRTTKTSAQPLELLTIPLLLFPFLRRAGDGPLRFGSGQHFRKRGVDLGIAGPEPSVRHLKVKIIGFTPERNLQCDGNRPALAAHFHLVQIRTIGNVEECIVLSSDRADTSVICLAKLARQIDQFPNAGVDMVLGFVAVVNGNKMVKVEIFGCWHGIGE